MFNNFRIVKLNKYVDRKNKGDCIIIYDIDTLGDNRELLIKLLNYKKLPYNYFNGAATDKLFIGVSLNSYKRRQKFLKLLKQFKGHRLTKAERKNLNSIRNGYYLSKKYLDEDVQDSEYGIYEPLDLQDNYWDNKDCSDWDTLPTRIKYKKRLIWEVFPELSSYKRMMYGEK